MKVWDLFVRLSHWLIVLLVASAWLSAEFGDAEFKWHSWNGFAVFVLVLSRVIWASVGSTTARFSHFIKPPKVIIAYLRSLFFGNTKTYLGHNPAGGVMVIAFWSILLAQPLTGMFSADDVFFEGPFSYYISGSMVKSATALHHFFFDLLVVLIVLHIIAIIYHQIIKKEKLVQAMITGKKPELMNNVTEAKNFVFRTFYLALFILGLVAMVFWWILNTYG